MQETVNALFERYSNLTNRALAGHVDVEAISDLYANNFIGAAPAGVTIGENDGEFAKQLEQGFARNRDIGTRSMTILSLQVDEIDDFHALAYVNWRADYDTAGGRTEIDFTNAYLVRVVGEDAKVFGWITGDEEEELRRHGVID